MNDRLDTVIRRDVATYALDQALVAAWYTQWWIPREQEFDFVDYFVAASTRNLSLLEALAGIDFDDLETRHELNRMYAESAEQVSLERFA